jgi:carboxyl-terminal processing protease
MKSLFKNIFLLLSLSISLYSCRDQDDPEIPAELQINNFVWNGLNFYYLWQANVPDLSDSKFNNQAELNSFLRGYATPETLFDALLYKPDSRFPKNEAVDRFSWIVADYKKLEGQLQGTTNNNGVEFGLSYKASGSSEIFGWVRYIIPNSNASTKDIKRGDFFYAVNGIQLTDKNYSALLFGNNDDYTLNMASRIDGQLTPNGKSVVLKKTVLSENPILVNKVIVSGSHKIGYLMYNSFYANYDTLLNEAFGSLKSAGISDLVLDLRYNSGGSMQSATRLASMITGSFTGKVFSKEQWNTKMESYLIKNSPKSLQNLFTDKVGNTPINSVNMSKVYILTSQNSASASELVINGLKPYIDVVQIGDVTAGKNVGSVTVYDSPNFNREGRNPNHRYAMQPLVLKIANAADFGDYQKGLAPTFPIKENLSTLDVLGNPSEPFLSLAISKINPSAKLKKYVPGIQYKYFTDSKSSSILHNQMYLEEVPKGLFKNREMR